MAEKRHTRVLTIAGSDSGGGAGIQADLKTFSALGCFGMSAITALTAQNTVGVTGIFPADAAFVAAQVDAVLSDIGADAVKIGMLFSVDIIEAVADRLAHYNVANVVLDPVMVAQSGDRLLKSDAVAAIAGKLMPLARVATPNLPEAEVLTGRRLETEEDVRDAARELAAMGARSVLIKGGHGKGDMSADLLFEAGSERFTTFSRPRLDTPNTHGTGCTLSSAIAAFIAKGHPVAPAVEKARDWLQDAIAAGAAYRIGRGCGPVHHFHGIWE